MTPSQPAAPSFFTNRSTQAIAQDLLGTHLLYTSHQGTLGGLIVEAEAYVGTDETAAHAYNGRRTPFSEPCGGGRSSSRWLLRNWNRCRCSG